MASFRASALWLFSRSLERDGAIEDGDMVWWGWEEAVIRLGATELEPTLKRVWTKVIFDQHEPEEHAESLARLHRAASDPANPTIFDEDEVCAIGDPAEALSWIGRRKQAIEAWETENRQPDDDPAQSIRLTDEEMDWLSGFLASRQAPEIRDAVRDARWLFHRTRNRPGIGYAFGLPPRNLGY